MSEYTIAGVPGTLYTSVGYELGTISLDNGQVLGSYALPKCYATEISEIALGSTEGIEAAGVKDAII